MDDFKFFKKQVFYIHQEAAVRMFYKIGVLKTLQNSQEKLLLKSLRNKVAGLNASNFIKKRPQQRCFPLNFVKFSRALNLQNTSGRPLLPFDIQVQPSKFIFTILGKLIYTYSPEIIRKLVFGEFHGNNIS